MNVSPDDVTDLYVPGAWRCPLCAFDVIEVPINAATGEIGHTARQLLDPEPRACPNDGELMVRVRWRDRAEAHAVYAARLLNELLAATGTPSWPDAMTHIKALRAAATATASVDCVRCSTCGRRCSQDVLAAPVEGMTGIVVRAFVQCPECVARAYLDKPLLK